MHQKFTGKKKALWLHNIQFSRNLLGQVLPGRDGVGHRRFRLAVLSGVHKNSVSLGGLGYF